MPNQLILEEIQPNQVSAQMQTVLGSAPGRILRFKNAVYARAERNKNGDLIDEQGLNELAATIALQPLDLEHDLQKLVGYYEAGRVQGSALLTDGILYASRFPEIAKGFATGEYQQSLEASAEEAECSLCHSVFSSEKEYCDHLKNRNAFQASRILRGLKATGGAVTKRPAGTDTKADPEQMEFVANIVMAKDANPEQVVLSFENESAYILWTKQPTLEVTAKVIAAESRKQLPDSDYALIQKRDNQTIRRFPIDNREHAQIALARVDQGRDMTDEERASVKTQAEAKLHSVECMRTIKAEAAIQSIIGMGMYEAGDLTWGTPGGVIPPVLSPTMYKAEPDPAFIEETVRKYLAGQTPQGNPVNPLPTPAQEQPVQASVPEPEKPIIDPRNRMGGLSISTDAQQTATRKKFQIPLH